MVKASQAQAAKAAAEEEKKNQAADKFEQKRQAQLEKYAKKQVDLQIENVDKEELNKPYPEVTYQFQGERI